MWYLACVIGAVTISAEMPVDGTLTGRTTGPPLPIDFLAEDAYAVPTPHPDYPPGPSPEPSPVTLEDVIAAFVKSVDDWRGLGWLAGMIAFVNFVILLLRFGPIEEWFKVNKRKWIKPYLAAVVGGLLGGLTAYQAEAAMINGVVAGLMAGFAATGWHEVVDKRKSKNRLS